MCRLMLLYYGNGSIKRRKVEIFFANIPLRKLQNKFQLITIELSLNKYDFLKSVHQKIFIYEPNFKKLLKSNKLKILFTKTNPKLSSQNFKSFLIFSIDLRFKKFYYVAFLESIFHSTSVKWYLVKTSFSCNLLKLALKKDLIGLVGRHLFSWLEKHTHKNGTA